MELMLLILNALPAEDVIVQCNEDGCEVSIEDGAIVGYERRK